MKGIIFRVLIVDDSTFICKRMTEILEVNGDFKVVGIAKNGKEAIRMTALTEPDVVTMDVEMPVMDGITAVKQIMAEMPTPILMFSASTQIGAKSTLEALEAGAIDFLPKNLDEINGNHELARQILRQRVRNVALQATRIKRTKVVKSARIPLAVKNYSELPNHGRRLTHHEFELLVIVASTGGPVAIQKILTEIPENCPIPILLVQHMPSNFTVSFAERLNQLCHIQVKEAAQYDELKPGVALLAPGGQQIQVERRAGKKIVTLSAKNSGDIYSPCADLTLTSIAKIYAKKALAVVLTGMGADGRKGAVKMHQTGAEIWAQEESSCTIYGMPKAIVDAGIAAKTYNLSELAKIFRAIS